MFNPFYLQTILVFLFFISSILGKMTITNQWLKLKTIINPKYKLISI